MLFIIAMSVLLQDAVDLLGPKAAALHASGKLTDVVYADDTLLIGGTDAHLEEYLAAVCEAGKKYGIELYFGKFQLISTAGLANVRTPDRTNIVVLGHYSTRRRSGGSRTEPANRHCKGRFWSPCQNMDALSIDLVSKGSNLQ